MLWWVVCQTVYSLQQTHYRSRWDSFHFFWRPALAFAMFCLRNVPNFHGRQRLYHRWRRYHLSWLCQRQAHVHCNSQLHILIHRMSFLTFFVALKYDKNSSCVIPSNCIIEHIIIIIIILYILFICLSMCISTKKQKIARFPSLYLQGVKQQDGNFAESYL